MELRGRTFATPFGDTTFACLRRTELDGFVSRNDANFITKQI